MNKALSEEEVLYLLRIWNNWMSGPDPANNKPQEYKFIDREPSEFLKIFFGLSVHLFLWSFTKFGQIFRLYVLSIWAAEKRIRYDNLWYEPHSCGLTNSLTDLGLGYLEVGELSQSIECLDRAWRVYPCPHNTSYGLRLKLYNKLKKYPVAKDVTKKYRDMWYKFKRA